MPNIEKRKGSGQEVFEPKDLVLELIEAGKVGSLADRLTNDEINEILKAFSSMKQAKAKGGNVEKQMELFQDGGLKDEGNTKDPVSGNDVPPGATQEEVRDDIPAQLSEGEFVFPADVVRYIGLEKLMMMRQEAKAGLKMMERMGQMGNADEATIPDDMPFSIIDIEIAEGDDDEVEERAQGGVIKAANGFAGTTTATNPLQTRQPSNMGVPTGLKSAYTAPIIPPATSAPTGGFTYKSPIDQTKKATYTGLFGGQELTQGPDEYRTFINNENVEIQIPFKNGKIFTGFTIPEGFKEKTEKVDTAKIQTARIKSSRVSDEGGESSGTTVGGAVDQSGISVNVSGLQSKGLQDAFNSVPSQLGMLNVYGGISRGITGKNNTAANMNGVLGGVLDDFRGGNVSFTGTNSKNTGLMSGVYSDNRSLNDLTKAEQDRLGVVAKSVIAELEPTFFSYNPKTGKYDQPKSDIDVKTELGKLAVELGIPTTIPNTNISKRQTTLAREIAKEKAKQKQQQIQNEIDTSIAEAIETEDDQGPGIGSKGFGVTGISGTGTGVSTSTGKGGIATPGVGIDSYDPSDDTPSDDDPGGFGGDPDTGFGMSDEDAIAKGSLVTKRKASGKLKKKYMKRGGLASR